MKPGPQSNVQTFVNNNEQSAILTIAVAQSQPAALAQAGNSSDMETCFIETWIAVRGPVSLWSALAGQPGWSSIPSSRRSGQRMPNFSPVSPNLGASFCLRWPAGIPRGKLLLRAGDGHPHRSGKSRRTGACISGVAPLHRPSPGRWRWKLAARPCRRSSLYDKKY